MNTNYQEIEVKFFIADLPALLEKVRNLGALMLRPRMLEVNLRFDTPDMQLGKRAQVLRLRQDDQSILTFKSPGKIVDGVISRTELEVLVSDFQTTRALLEALGFQVFMTYEKYRQNFKLNDLVASVDELPYGNFIELEGSSPEHVRSTAALLGLDWEQRINLSYTALLGLFNQNTGHTFQDLSFEVFSGLRVLPEQLGLAYADDQL
jgi:adenylate cyclase class 2